MKNYKNSLLLLTMLLSSLSLFSQTLLHNFEFDGNLNDTKATGISLSEINTSSSSYATSPNSWTWAQSTKPGGGLELLTDQLPDETNYSLGFRIKFNETGGGYRKIITFKGSSSDNGLYFQNNKLRLFPGGTTSSSSYSSNTFYDFVLTRASDNTFKIYTVSGGSATEVFSLTDTDGDAIPVLNGANREFRFFMNDNDNRDEHTTGGTARSIRMWDRALTAQEIEDALPAVTNNATGVSPTSATLNGKVNPQGSSATFSFEWGTTTAYGNTLSSTTPASSSASSPVSVQASLTGLTAGQIYHYRIKSTTGSAEYFGEDKIFNGMIGVDIDMSVWLKADAGTGSIGTSWQDQSGNGKDYATVAGPTVQADALNYNKGVEILSGGFDAPSSAALTSDWTLFFISKKMASDNSGRIFDGHAGNYLWAHHGTSRNGIYLDNSPGDHVASFTTNDGIENLHLHSYARESGGGLEARTDGESLKTYTSSNSANGVRIDINVGYNSAESSDSRIGEVIIYNTQLNATEINKVESYLGIKYSVSLFGDYIASNSTKFWNAAVGPSYQNSIIGIGRDITSDLLQKQSQSAYDSLRIYVGSLAAGNTSNAATISNDISYIMIGHNDDLLYSIGSTEFPSGEGIYSRIEREWKISNTNFDETFSLEIKLHASAGTIDESHIRVLLDADGDFSNATVINPTVTNSGGILTVSGLSTSDIPKNSVRYITIASINSETPLPIELLYFGAKIIDDRYVELNWKTSSEVNNNYFTLERSLDGSQWKKLVDMAGAGNSTIVLDYTYIDNNPLKGVSYYRLKQTDYDGLFIYFEQRSIRNSSTVSVEVYPSSTHKQVIVKGPASKLENIRIYNELGQDITRHCDIVVQSPSVVKIDISKLNSGVYFIKTGNTANRVFKM